MEKKDQLKITRRQFIKGSLFLGTTAVFSSYRATLVNSQTNKRRVQIISGLKNPYGVAVSQSGSIYVSDAGNYCIKIFNSEGELIKKIGKPGSKGSGLNFPQGVQVDDNGDIYVMDSNNGRIAIFNLNGELKGSIGTIGGYPGAFYTPKGIYLHNDGRIYAANTRNHTIYVFDKTTQKLLASYGLLGEDPAAIQKGSIEYRFRLPTDIALTPDGTIYIVDSKHGTIKVLDNEGRFLFKFGENGSDPGQFNSPEGIALDSNQNVYVCDTLNSRIQKFTSDGKFLDQENQGFEKPTGICIDVNDNLYIVDSANNVVKIFKWS